MITPALFKDIQAEAALVGIPRGFGRAVLREYLQCEIMYLLSNLRGSEKLAFIGGTGLRLLYNLDRFSEDLDFDNCGLSSPAVASLLNRLVEQIKKRDYAVVFRPKSAGLERGGKLIFNSLLYNLGLSPHRDEKLMIKIEYTAPKPPPRPTIALLNRFGFTAQIATEPLPALCARKLIALKQRRRIQPRDLYDLAWFFSRRIVPDRKTLKNFGVASLSIFRDELLQMLQKHKTKLAEYERDLAPFVLNPERIASIRHLPNLLAEFLA